MAKDDDPVNPFGMRGRRPAPKRKAGRRTPERRPDIRPPPPVRPPPPATPVTPGPQIPPVPGAQVPPVPGPSVPSITPPEPVPEPVVEESVAEIAEESAAEISEEPPAAEPITAGPTAETEVELEVISDKPEIVERDEPAIVEDEEHDGEEGVDAEDPPEPTILHPDAIPELTIPKIKEEVGGPPFRRRRQRVKTPSKRVTKLDRRKYMEYKVDLREILEEEDVPEEHRANVLGTTWARGERSGITAAEDYVNEKLAEGVLTEESAQRILKVLRRYTTRR